MQTKESILTKLEKGRAEFAYNCVKQAKKELENDQKQREYRSCVRKIPQMILSNGLGQTLAFIYAKKENGDVYDLIYKQFTDYLKSSASIRINMPENQTELIEWVISLDSYNYRYVTEELISFLKWLRKFAEGMIKVEGEE